MDRQEAQKILDEYVKADSLKKHCLGVAVCMESYAEKLNEDKEKYFVTGLLHDFDWEIHPSMEEHPSEGVKMLREMGVSEDICEAIMGHSNHTGVARVSNLARVLFAVDELSGLVIAVAKVKGGFDSITPDSVRNAMKKKGFAAAINRDDIRQGISELEVDEDEHFQLVIDALAKHKEELGF